MTFPDFLFERKLHKQGYKLIAGIDEVGRGAFAGAVVAGCVVFNNQIYKSANLQIKIDDSKKLTSKQREKADKWIRENCLACAVGSASVAQINKLGIKKATEIAFRKAVREANNCLQSTDYRLLPKEKTVDRRPFAIDYLLIDAFNIPRVSGLPLHKQNAIIKGDSRSISIAAASIIAKVHRDNLMTSLSKKSKYKKYQWHKNKGYGTREHREAISKYGATRLHRKTFVNTWLINSKH
jgi:ribonuclease HII